MDYNSHHRTEFTFSAGNSFWHRPVQVFNSNNFSGLHSFGNWPYEMRNSLIEWGFLYTGLNDTLMCPTCNIKIRFNSCKHKKELYQEHMVLSPNCEIAKYVCTFENARKCTTKEYTYETALHPKFIIENERMRTYNMNKEKLFSTDAVQRLASAGYFFKENNTEVCCFYCGMMIEVEEQIEDPLMVHARFAPKCSFIVDKIKKMDSYNFIQEQEYLGKALVPMYPNLTNEHDRKGTFLKGTMSEIYGSQTPSYLAHTGFFAVSIDEIVHLTCYCCGLSVLPWYSSVCPWVVHAVYRGFCRYLETRKGLQYIRDVQQKYQRSVLQNDFSVFQINEDEYCWEPCFRSECRSLYCVKCKLNERTIMFSCGHFLTCQHCSILYFVCPYCHTPVTKATVMSVI